MAMDHSHVANFRTNLKEYKWQIIQFFSNQAIRAMYWWTKGIGKYFYERLQKCAKHMRRSISKIQVFSFKKIMSALVHRTKFFALIEVLP